MIQLAATVKLCSFVRDCMSKKHSDEIERGSHVLHNLPYMPTFSFPVKKKWFLSVIQTRQHAISTPPGNLKYAPKIQFAWILECLEMMMYWSLSQRNPRRRQWTL